jgi:hypothetical protein|eukprot:COSAG06_NODE_446_length_15654_cov_8.176278_9_plen_288_part_00
MRIEFMSDGSVTADGFSATYECIDPGDPCDGGMDVSPPFTVNFGGSSQGQSCQWTASCGNRPVHAFFHSLSATGGDALALYDGDSTSSAQIGADITGTVPPEAQAGESTMMTLSASPGASFVAEFECGPEPNPCDTGGNADLQIGGDACSVTSLLCGSGEISSGTYGNNADCTWRVQCDSGPVTLTFTSFSLEANFDYVYVADMTLTGSSTPAPITTDLSSIDIVLESDGSVTSGGFDAVVECPGGGGAPPGLGGMDACSGDGEMLHGDNEIEFSLPAQGSQSSCIW